MRKLPADKTAVESFLLHAKNEDLKLFFSHLLKLRPDLSEVISDMANKALLKS